MTDKKKVTVGTKALEVQFVTSNEGKKVNTWKMVPWTERITVFGQCSNFKPFHVLSHDRDMKRFEG